MLRITKAELSNLEALREISISTFVESFAHLNTAADFKIYLEHNFSPSKLADELSNPASIFFLVYQNTEIIAYLKLNLSSAQTETKYLNSLEIERIYVLNNFKGNGIGTKLIFKAKEIALKHNLNFIWLGVWEKNTEAIAFYKKHGFNEFGNHVFMLGKDAQKDILMRLDF